MVHVLQELQNVHVFTMLYLLVTLWMPRAATVDSADIIDQDQIAGTHSVILN